MLLKLLALERLDARLPLRVSEDQLDLLLHLFELLIAEAGEPNAFLEELQRLIERHLLRLQTLHDGLELLKGFFEFVGLAGHQSLVILSPGATQSQAPWSSRQPCIPCGPFSAALRSTRRWRPHSRPGSACACRVSCGRRRWRSRARGRRGGRRR